MKTEIYLSGWRATGMLLLCAIIIVFLYYFPKIIQKEPPVILKIITPIAIAGCVLCFILCCVLLWMKAIHKPLATIYDDRLEFLIPRKLKYFTIRYEEVDQFFLLDLNSAKILMALTFDGQQKETGLSSSQVSHLKDVCNLLNEKLAAYRGISEGVPLG